MSERANSESAPHVASNERAPRGAPALLAERAVPDPLQRIRVVHSRAASTTSAATTQTTVLLAVAPLSNIFDAIALRSLSLRESTSPDPVVVPASIVQVLAGFLNCECALFNSESLPSSSCQRSHEMTSEWTPSVERP